MKARVRKTKEGFKIEGEEEDTEVEVEKDEVEDREVEAEVEAIVSKSTIILVSKIFKCDIIIK